MDEVSKALFMDYLNTFLWFLTPRKRDEPSFSKDQSTVNII